MERGFRPSFPIYIGTQLNNSMAKSRFEAKKIVRYSESSIPKNGISGRPTPRIQASPAAAKAAVVAAVEAPAQPAVAAVPPAPPVVGEETRAFVFDGSTELTSSFSTSGGNTISSLSVGFSLNPGWGPADTGSYTIFSISNPSEAADFRLSLYFERTSGSDGYVDKLSSQLTSGSVYYKTSMKLPNFHNVSSSNTSFTAYIDKGSLSTAYRNSVGFGYRLGHFITSSLNSGNLDRYNAANTLLDSTNYALSLGGFHSGSNGYLTGSMDGFYIAKDRKWHMASPFTKHLEKQKAIDIIYKFEGTVSASKGDKDLSVIGTETYVSSSL